MRAGADSVHAAAIRGAQLPHRAAEHAGDHYPDLHFRRRDPRRAQELFYHLPALGLHAAHDDGLYQRGVRFRHGGPAQPQQTAAFQALAGVSGAGGVLLFHDGRCVVGVFRVLNGLPLPHGHAEGHDHPLLRLRDARPDEQQYSYFGG